MKFEVETPILSLLATTRAEALAKGVPLVDVAAAIKAKAKSEIARVAHDYRALVEQAAEGRIASYDIKAKIAADVPGASAESLAMIDLEAAALSLDRTAFLAGIASKLGSIEVVFLQIDAMQAQAGADIDAIDDTAVDIEDQVSAILESKKAEAKAAFAVAKSTISGS